MSTPGDDKLNEMIRRINQDRGNGTNPSMLPPGVKPRPSGFVCPKCGQPAMQRVDPAPGTILGYRWALIKDSGNFFMPEDDRPSPISVVCPEITERDSDGNATRVYTTIHCLNCFNIWQHRKMMEEVRANVPQLEWRPNDAGADSSA